MDLFEEPTLDATDQGVLREVKAMRDEAAGQLRSPRRWTGGLRRTAQARAIQGSNTIEGYTVSEDDALAAVDDEAPLTADERTWAEILGYRRVLTYVLQMAGDPDLRVDSQLLRTLHFMLLEHELAKRPGQFRAGDIDVTRESDGATVYEGPDAELVPGLMDQLSDRLARTTGELLVDAAMAHLNLVMIHPFKDGNGRMARALQTLVLARGQVLDPIFSSIEEWLGHNTEDYYRVLAVTGRGRWHPGNDTHDWVRFTLRAHDMQAQTVSRRLAEAEVLGQEILRLIEERGLPERVFDPLFDATLGLRVRRPTYVKRSGLEDRTATRDLKELVDAGLLTAFGQTKGRYYLAAGDVKELRSASTRRRARLVDPYPDLMRQIAERARAAG